MLLTEVVDWFPENHCCWTTFIGNYILTICMYMFMYMYIYWEICSANKDIIIVTVHFIIVVVVVITFVVDS